MDRTLKVFIAPEDPSREAVLRAGLASFALVEIVGCYARWTGQDYAASLAGVSPDAFLVDAWGGHAAFLSLPTFHRQRFPGSVTVFITAPGQTAFQGQAVTQGATAVFLDPPDWTQVGQALASNAGDGAPAPAAHPQRPEVETTQVIRRSGHGGAQAPGTAATTAAAPGTDSKRTVAFVSAKDGEGKTTIAVNLAATLAYTYGKRVILVDLNTNFDDFTVLMNQRSRMHLVDVVRTVAAGTPAAQVLESLADLKADGRLRFLCGPCSIRPVLLDQPALTRTLAMLRAECDVLLLDTPVFLNEALATALAVADRYYVVVQNQIASLRNTKAYLAALCKADYPRDRFGIVVNRVAGRIGLTEAELINFLAPFPVAGRIPSAGELVIESLNEGVPFALSKPTSEVSQGIDRLATTLLGS